MDLSTKKKIMEELERFVNRKELYKREGKAWKREYMLFGPSITGKSRLIQAMTNFLNCEIYELKLNGIKGNNELLNLLITTKNNSILVVKYCSTKFPARHEEGVAESTETLENQVTLSRLLNLFVGLWSRGGDGRIIVFMTNHKEKVDLALHYILVAFSGLLNLLDGLWSSEGDGRIIVFMTNHKEKVDPALLHPGRLDIMESHFLSDELFRGFKRKITRALMSKDKIFSSNGAISDEVMGEIRAESGRSDRMGCVN
ncbi:hypothetical protein Pint_16329 [Pistacia integerrima]|uniref:Uncharacterized protein n=1 Tax=Pistacia integerrima TaxID=434235 RepID=A0ACC0Z8M4_9ROSI|nr:hypothetical protein Pint_16329 [Pistacia integerrima]